MKAVHNDLQKTINLLKKNFEGYFEGLEWDKFRDYWGNPTISALYIHDKSLNREEFIQRYEQRILKSSGKNPSYLVVINHGENMSSTDENILIINENW